MYTWLAANMELYKAGETLLAGLFSLLRRTLCSLGSFY